MSPTEPIEITASPAATSTMSEWSSESMTIPITRIPTKAITQRRYGRTMPPTVEARRMTSGRGSDVLHGGGVNTLSYAADDGPISVDLGKARVFSDPQDPGVEDAVHLFQ